MHYSLKRLLALFLTTISLYGCSDNNKSAPDSISDTPAVAETPDIPYSVKQTFPHDTTLFTEGFVVHQGQLFESTGSPEGEHETRSLIGPLNLKTGKMDEKV